MIWVNNTKFSASVQEMLVKVCRSGKAKNSSNLFNRCWMHLVQNLICIKMRPQPLNPKVGLLRSISLNLHSNVLERVSVFLRELATPLLLVRHWSSSLGVGESSCLGVWSRVGVLWSSNASCPACREDCETKRKDVVIFRMGARYYLVRRMRPLKGRLFLLHTTQGLIF